MKAKNKKSDQKKSLQDPKAIPREQWEKHFKAAIKAGHLPDKVRVEIFSNQFDDKSWTW